MHATKTKQAQHGGGDRPLAESVFSGESRLRELEHLAETARKVRDQAAAELTRSGSTHHIARDRIAAAERMLRKTQQEMAELRAQLGPSGRPAPPPAQTDAPQDFELAVLLGHSKARFNRDGASQASLQLQQEHAPRAGKTTAPRGKSAPRRASTRATQHSAGSIGRNLVFSILVTFGVGLGAVGTYAVAKTDSLTEATQLVREQGQQLMTRLRALIPASVVMESAEPKLAQASAISVPRATTTAGTRATQEAQARAAAEQRLMRQISGRVAQP